MVISRKEISWTKQDKAGSPGGMLSWCKQSFHEVGLTVLHTLLVQVSFARDSAATVKSDHVLHRQFQKLLLEDRTREVFS